MLLPKLERVSLRQGQVVIPAHTPLTQAWFPESGIASVIASTDDGRQQEVGLYGNEGVGSLAVVLGAGQTPHKTLMQVGGSWLRIEAPALRDAVEQLPGLRTVLLRYVHCFMVSITCTALSNNRNTIEERLARWLLMAHDRLDGDELPLTHTFLSLMLGVRRPGVTLAVHVLEGAGLIRARRSLITILNRPALEAAAGTGYGVAEAEYERLIGPMSARRGALHFV
ncbi:Crp/Fnr family transcriptional regulator [Roseomonas elaeocarpi]|uniref:Crp/Fnr family transcriptional regulator n=1 Tax=Roseomonas elaeocarpi TaxID=907779 RepID=A0ABV6JX97_9PROT